MFNFQYIWASVAGQIWMQIFVVCTLIYMLYRYRHDILSVAIILMCWPRVFIFFDKIAENPYKIAILALCGYLFIRHRCLQVIQKKEYWWLIAFGIFTLQFFITALLFTQNSFTILFSQYSRYLEAVLLFFIIKEAVWRKNKKDELLRLFYEIGLMQIIISIFKWIVFRMQIESLVGSFTIVGGAQGTTIPILWFIVLWKYRNGEFRWHDWLYILGLLLVGFTTGKRAVMFILPVVVLVFMVYVQGIQLKRYIWVGIAFVPLIFYLGVRLTPTLNPEKQVWGSFDWDYAFGYAETYQFGKTGMQGQIEKLEAERKQISYGGGIFAEKNRKIESKGRGGATIALLKLILGNHATTDSDWWGLGFNSMYSTDYGEFKKLPLSLNIDHKGSATGIIQSYVTTGIWGALCTILWGFLPLLYFRKRKLGIAISGICVWEYFMYTGFILRTPIFMCIIFLIMHISNQEAMINKHRTNTIAAA